MPELPEVETVKRQVEALISGEEIVAAQKSGLNLRKDLGCSLLRLKGQKISGVSRWGKRLLVHLGENASYLDVSLGMTGMLRVAPKGSKAIKHDHVTLRFKNGDKLIYNDPRRFGWVSYSEVGFNYIGWDPILSSKKDFQKITLYANKSQKSIYSFLMDQKYIVGLGNIYVQEILFKSKISPFRLTSDCSADDLEALRKNTKIILNKALGYGGSTILSYKNAEGKSGAFQNKLKVYGKKKAEPCAVCKNPLTHVMEARSVSYCSQCQK